MCSCLTVAWFPSSSSALSLLPSSVLILMVLYCLSKATFSFPCLYYLSITHFAWLHRSCWKGTIFLCISPIQGADSQQPWSTRRASGHLISCACDIGCNNHFFMKFISFTLIFKKHKHLLGTGIPKMNKI